MESGDYNMKKPKLIICDIDSTLVVKHQLLTKRAKAVIDKLRNNGIYFGIASGRPIFQIMESVHKWGYDDFDVIVGLNGSSLRDSLNNKEYDYYWMKKEWIKETIDLMSIFDPHPSIYRDEAQLFAYEDEFSQRAFKFSGLQTIIANDISELYERDTAKIMFRVTEEQMPEVEQWVKENPSEHYTGFKTQPDLFEFCNKNVSKAIGLEKFCDIHGIDLDEVIAFGDTTNDNEMLIAAGLGVCMKNGSEDTKAIADEITDLDCDEDGWADYMEKHLSDYGIS